MLFTRSAIALAGAALPLVLTATPAMAAPVLVQYGDVMGVYRGQYRGSGSSTDIARHEARVIAQDQEPHKCVNLSDLNGGRAFDGAGFGYNGDTAYRLVLFEGLHCRRPVGVLPEGAGRRVVKTARWRSYRLQESVPALRRPTLGEQPARPRSTASLAFYHEAPDETDPGFRLVRPIVGACLRTDGHTVDTGPEEYVYLDVRTPDPRATLTMYRDSGCKDPVHRTRLNATRSRVPINPAYDGDIEDVGYSSVRITRR